MLTIFRIQDKGSIMCGFYCVPFIEYMLARKTLSEYTNLLSPNGYKNNDKITFKFWRVNMSSLELRLKKRDESRNYLLEERKHNDLMSEKH